MKKTHLCVRHWGWTQALHLPGKCSIPAYPQPPGAKTAFTLSSWARHTRTMENRHVLLEGQMEE